MNRYPRDFRGYGANPPDAAWPGGARIAVQFVLNYEEGGENCLLHGDAASEAFLSEVVGAQPWPGQRHWNMESIYEYGARAGFWRLHRLFTGAGVPVTVYGVATALARATQATTVRQRWTWLTSARRSRASMAARATTEITATSASARAPATEACVASSTSTNARRRYSRATRTANAPTRLARMCASV